MRTLYAYMSTERWRALFDSRGELAVAELTDDPNHPLDDDTRLRIAVEIPHHWPARRSVPLARWRDAFDRRDVVTLWDRNDLLVCAPPRGQVIGRPPGA